MNKYQKVMEHVKVDDEMKKRILQNVEKELAREGGVSSSSMADKIVPFGKRLGDGIRQYAGIAAMFAILLVGAAAVVKMTGGVSNMSTSPAMSETATEAPAATESAEMAEAPAATESAYEEAAEATYEDAEATYDSAEMAEAPAATETPAEPAPEHVSWVHYIAPILLPIIMLAVIILIIWLIVRYFRRRK